MTATAAVRAVPRTWQLSSEALAIMGRFPPRPVPPAWAAASQDRTAVVRRMLQPPFLVCDYKARHVRKLTLLKVPDWLELHPGKTWQERWDATGPALTAVRAAGPGSWLISVPPAASALRAGTSSACWAPG